jgi:diacylglycerol kinase family enzyme
MKVLILHNHSSGTGARRALVDESERLLRADGHEVSRMAPMDAGASDAITHAVLVVIAGGDGTVHHALPALVRSRAAMYHLPLGTENLFARHFGMDRHAVTLRRAVANPAIAEIDLGEANGTLFSLMVSAGPDAGVIHDLASTRNGPISHLTYLAPIRRQLSIRPAPLWIEADGTTIVEDRPGWHARASNAHLRRSSASPHVGQTVRDSTAGSTPTAATAPAWSSSTSATATA